jgi:ERF superfamily
METATLSNYTLTRSDQLDKIAPAFCGIQSIGIVAVERSQNKQVGSPYADTFAVWDALQEPIKKHNLAVIQLPGEVRKVGDEYVIGLTTLVLHESGQFLQGCGEFIIQFIQSKSSGGLSKTWASAATITYLRRYSLVCMFGILTGDDDDAQRFVEKVAVEANVPRKSRSTGDGEWAALTGGEWKQQRGPDQRLFNEYTVAEIRDLTRNTLEEDPAADNPALKAFLWDQIDMRLSALGEELVPALTSRGWEGETVPDAWSLAGFRKAYNTLFQEIIKVTGAPGL